MKTYNKIGQVNLKNRKFGCVQPKRMCSDCKKNLDSKINDVMKLLSVQQE
jgi:hypothetical protein